MVTSLPEAWSRAIQRDPGTILWEWADDGSAFTRAEADVLARRVASWLRSQGVGPGDRVAVEAVTHPEVLLLCWGAWWAGAVVALLPAGRSRDAALVSRIRPRLSLEAGTGLDGALALPPLGAAPPADPDADALLLCTSGSTGGGRVVRLSHRALAGSVDAMARAFRWSRGDRFLGAGAWHTMSGARNALLMPPLAGGMAVVPDPLAVVQPRALLRLADEAGATLLQGTPALLAACLRDREAPRPRALRAVLCTGAPLPHPLRDGFARRFGVPVLDYYGLTETSGICLAVDPDFAGVPEPGVGRPVGAEVQVRDGSGRSLPVGVEGILAVRSPRLGSGYTDGPLDLDAEGWLRTGDRARWTADGGIALLGRAESLLIHRSGENVWADDVEAALYASLPDLTHALAATCADGDGVERIGALVVFAGVPPESWRTRLRGDLRGRLPAAARPEQVLAVEAIPVTAAGKPDREAAGRLLAKGEDP